MESNTIYVVITGEYSDWKLKGFFTDKDKAERYCAIKNKQYANWVYSNYDDADDDNHGNYYVKEITKIGVEVPKVTLQYRHEVMFDIGRGMRIEPDRYEYYIGEAKSLEIECSDYRWVKIILNNDSREKAEKIAQDKFAEFMYYYSENNSIEATAKLIGAKVM